jgi:hypothetical protein
MHGDVEQEGINQNCEFHYHQDRGFTPKAGPHIVDIVYI